MAKNNRLISEDVDIILLLWWYIIILLVLEGVRV